MKTLCLISSAVDNMLYLVEEGNWKQDAIDSIPLEGIDDTDKEGDGGYCESVEEAIGKMIKKHNIKKIEEYDDTTGNFIDTWSDDQF